MIFCCCLLLLLSPATERFELSANNRFISSSSGDIFACGPTKETDRSRNILESGICCVVVVVTAELAAACDVGNEVAEGRDCC